MLQILREPDDPREVGAVLYGDECAPIRVQPVNAGKGDIVSRLQATDRRGDGGALQIHGGDTAHIVRHTESFLIGGKRGGLRGREFTGLAQTPQRGASARQAQHGSVNTF